MRLCGGRNRPCLGTGHRGHVRQRAGQFADAARGRHPHLRQRQRHRDRRRQRPDRLRRQQAGRPARRLQSQDRTAGGQRRCRDRRQQRHAGLFRRDRHHRRFRQRLRQCVARRDDRQDLLRGRKRRARRRHDDDLPQRRLYGLRTVRGKTRQSPDLAHQGAEDHLERQGKDGSLRALALRVVRHADRLLPGDGSAGPDRQAQDRLPHSGHQLQQRPRRRRHRSVLRGALADLRPDADRTLLFEAGLPRRGRMAPALQQRLLQSEGRRHQPARPRGIRLRPRGFRHGGRPEQARAGWSARRACSTSIRAGRSAGTCWSRATRIFRTPTISTASARPCTNPRST